MNETKQAKRARRGTKHGHSAPLGAGWGSGRREQGNQSPYITSVSTSEGTRVLTHYIYSF